MGWALPSLETSSRITTGSRKLEEDIPDGTEIDGDMKTTIVVRILTTDLSQTEPLISGEMPRLRPINER